MPARAVRSSCTAGAWPRTSSSWGSRSLTQPRTASFEEVVRRRRMTPGVRSATTDPARCWRSSSTRRREHRAPARRRAGTSWRWKGGHGPFLGPHAPGRAARRFRGTAARRPVAAASPGRSGAHARALRRPDKRATGLGAGARCGAGALLDRGHVVRDHDAAPGGRGRGVGALFFGVFQGEAELRVALAIPADLQLLGALALGGQRRDPTRRVGLSAVAAGAAPRRSSTGEAGRPGAGDRLSSRGRTPPGGTCSRARRRQ